MSEETAAAYIAKIRGTRPSRRGLLEAVGECQDLFGAIRSAAADRNPDRAEDIDRLTALGLALCVEARAGDPP